MKQFLAALVLLSACVSAPPIQERQRDAAAAAAGTAALRLPDPAATLRPDIFDAPASASNNDAAKSTPEESAETIYACPMHPEVTSHEPGKCPKCGMTLVKKVKQ